MEMKNNRGDTYRITASSPIIKNLRLSGEGPIAQVIRGRHRTEVARRLSDQPETANEGFWLYRVLLPSKLFIYISLINIDLFLKILFSYQPTSQLHSPRLLLHRQHGQKTSRKRHSKRLFQLCPDSQNFLQISECDKLDGNVKQNQTPR